MTFWNQSQNNRGCPELGDTWAVGWRNELLEWKGHFRFMGFFSMPLTMSASSCTVVKIYKIQKIANNNV